MTVRRRRSAEESRALILEVAAQRLAEHGIEGLNIKGVSQEAGISHATLIHHFGSSGGMRIALADKMTMELVTDLVAAFDKDISRAELTRKVFRALSEGEHAKLIAWRAVEGQGREGETTPELADGFNRLMRAMHKVIEAHEEKDLQNLVLLVGLAALGYGLAGGALAQLIGMDQQALESFPDWTIDHIS